MVALPALFHLQDQARRNAGDALRVVRRERARAAPAAPAPEPVPVTELSVDQRPNAWPK